MRQGPPLVLHPRACDRCGRCLDACERDALRVGRTYLKVDWTACDGCGACARACPRGAITLRGRQAHAPAGTPRPRATTGSRSRKPAASAAATPRSRSRAGAPGHAAPFAWTLLEAAAMLSVTFSAFMVKEMLGSMIGTHVAEPGTAVAAHVAALVVYYAIQLVVLVWLVRRRGGDVLDAVGLGRPGTSAAHKLGSIGLVVGLLVLTRLAATAYAFITREIGIMPETGVVDLPGLFGTTMAGWALAVVMVVVIAPLAEEVVFRAALLEGLAARIGAWPAIIAQAVVFAALHRSVWLLFPTFVLGLALGYLAHTRRSLWPAIALHAGYNAITVGAAFALSQGL